jgi:hypothetical protein
MSVITVQDLLGHAWLAARAIWPAPAAGIALCALAALIPDGCRHETSGLAFNVMPKGFRQKTINEINDMNHSRRWAQLQQPGRDYAYDWKFVIAECGKLAIIGLVAWWVIWTPFPL